MPTPMKILFVCEIASVHAARWVNQLRGAGEVHVFHAGDPRSAVAPELRCGTVYLPAAGAEVAGVRQVGTIGALGQWPRVARRVPASWVRAAHLARLGHIATRVRPDVIHSLGLNVNWTNLGLPVVEARTGSAAARRAAWVYSSWGTDLEVYAAMSAAHRDEVSRVLRECDFHLSECARDERLARELGFRGECLGHLPAFGGVDEELMQRMRQAGKASQRTLVVLKGRDRAGGDPVGRAMVAMDALERCHEELRRFHVVIVQASAVVARRAAELNARHGTSIEVLPRVPYETVLRTYGAARVSISLTVNDGLPSTLVESMALGALPLHSDLEPVREWVTDGRNGLLVPAEDAGATADALRRALTDDALVDEAAARNATLVAERLSDSAVRPRALELYRRIAEGAGKEISAA